MLSCPKGQAQIDVPLSPVGPPEPLGAELLAEVEEVSDELQVGARAEETGSEGDGRIATRRQVDRRHGRRQTGC